MIALGLALLIAEGTVAPQVRVQDQDGHEKTLPANHPILVIYEDQDGGKQNHHAKDVIGKLNTDKANQARVDVLPIADLEKWNWWPAKKYALADIQKQARQKRTTIYLDWTGQLRKSWQLDKAKNHLILIGTDGKVLFTSQGECPPAVLDRLLSILAGFGFK